jgi:hypothetical protein
MRRVPLVFMSAISVGLVAASGAGATAVSVQSRQCSGAAQWDLHLDFTGTGYADVSVTGWGCDRRTTSVDTDGLQFGSQSDRVDCCDFSARFLVSQVATVAGGTEYAAYSWTPGQPAAVIDIAGDNLAATTPGLYDDGTVVAWQYAPAGRCGPACFTTTVTGAAG